MGSVEIPSSSTMAKKERYLVQEVQTKETFEQVLDVIWAANHTPYEPFIQLFFPVLGFTHAHRDAAIAESRERFWKQHQDDSSSHWFCATDSTTGEMVGCAQWVISEINPFAKGVPKLQAPWWPEGEGRRFCESILNQVYKPRASWMKRPHCALNWMAVHPTHRHRGIGSQLMSAGLSLVDALHLESWMEASLMGKPLYEKFGFRPLLKFAFDTDFTNASDEWKRYAHEMTPGDCFAMWRPKEGVWEGEDGGGVEVPGGLESA